MAISANPYFAFLVGLASGEQNFTALTYKLSLLTSAYVPNMETHSVWADCSSYELSTSGTGYAAVTLTSVTVDEDPAGGTAAVMVGDPVQWNALTATTRYAVIYCSDNNNLVGLIDFGADRVYNGEPLVLSFPDGFVVISN